MPEIARELKFYGSDVCLKSFPDDVRGQGFMGSQIIAPEKHAEPSPFATVVALGDAKRDRHIFTVKIGDTVLCNRYPKSARPINWRGQEFVIVDENEILAKVEERRDADWWNRTTRPKEMIHGA